MFFVPLLEMVNDMVKIIASGLQAVEMNAALNAKIECKKLRLSFDKSQKCPLVKRVQQKQCVI